ncbi:MAG: hypothetical protein Q7J54_01185 [Candidatus Woesearchaeota archaeon]|nr:hypothetical protein [Candidatus Woesearchaeota archaeon]
MSGCGGKPLVFDEIGEKRFDGFLGNLYTDTARARAIRLLYEYLWKDSKLPDKYKKFVNEIDGLGWNAERHREYGINCTEEEKEDARSRFEEVCKRGLIKSAQSYFTDQLNNAYIRRTNKNIGLLAAEAILDGKTDLGIAAFIYIGNINLEYLGHDVPPDFFKAAMVAQKSGKSDLAVKIIKGLLVHYEEAAYDFKAIAWKGGEVLENAKSILEKDNFQKAGFKNKLIRYKSLDSILYG